MVNARVKFTGRIRTVMDAVRYAKVYPKPLPTIPVTVPEKHYRLKHGVVKTGEGRHIIIQGLLTDLFRDERIEVEAHRAVQARAYAERLIQMAIVYGDRHIPTMETCSYYMLEKNLVQKIFKVFVPRFRDCKTAYTCLFFLPQEYTPHDKYGYLHREPAVLELKGNPYPPVLPKPEDHHNSLLNVLLNEARKRFNAEKAKEMSLQITEETKVET